MSKSRNKILQTWEQPYRDSLYNQSILDLTHKETYEGIYRDQHDLFEREIGVATYESIRLAGVAIPQSGVRARENVAA